MGGEKRKTLAKGGAKRKRGEAFEEGASISEKFSQGHSDTNGIAELLFFQLTQSCVE